MKKLVVLMLVLAMASLANAGLVFTVNGEEQPAEITINIGDAIELDLELPTGSVQAYQLMYSLNNEQAELIVDAYDQWGDPYSNIQFPWQSLAPGSVNAKDDVGVCSWVEIKADNLFSAANGPLVLMTDMYLHCLENTDVVLTISISERTIIDGEEQELGEVHSLTVHQIPEPMTIALLGLGSLFVRRRK